jgi:hypothetical protein
MIERLILTTEQILRLLPLNPLCREALRRELVAISDGSFQGDGHFRHSINVTGG